MNRVCDRRLRRAVLAILVGVAASAAPAGSDTTPGTAAAGAAIVACDPDAFCDPPQTLPARPGALLRSQPLEDVALPKGVRGWRILYSTTVDDRTAATAVATVFAPVEPQPGPRPVFTWEHGTTDLLQKCTPSLISAPTAGIPARDEIVSHGWVVVATDYSFTEKGGPHPYLVGEGEARAATDAVRAAKDMPELNLDPRAVVWGHSQGGHAALWTGIVAPGYAPDVQIAGVAAMTPAADMANILATNLAVNKRLGPYVALSCSRFYPDVAFEDALRPEALAAAPGITGLCGFLPPEDPERIATLTAGFEGPSPAMTASNPIAARLAQNRADRRIQAPVLIAQGLADPVVPPVATDAYVSERCDIGQTLTYWTFAGHDHGTIVRPGATLEQPLIDWAAARFGCEPAEGGCVRRSFDRPLSLPLLSTPASTSMVARDRCAGFPRATASWLDDARSLFAQCRPLRSRSSCLNRVIFAKAS